MTIRAKSGAIALECAARCQRKRVQFGSGHEFEVTFIENARLFEVP
jgi:hypothetical protein